MRSHVIVLAVVVAALALIFVLARQGSDAVPIVAPADPVIAIERGKTASNAEIGTEAATPSVTTVAEPASAPAEARKAAEPITTCTLGGYVLLQEGEGRTPVSRAYVGLFRPALVPDSPDLAFGQWTGPADFRPRQHQLVTWDYSDDDGKFEFDELKPGTYLVRVELGPLIVRVGEPHTLAPGEVRAGLLIRLPASGGLSGTILAPPGVDFEAWRVGMQRKDPLAAPMYVDGMLLDMVERSVDADGTFHLDPGEAGPHNVWLFSKQELSPRRQVTKILIGEVQIVAGEDVERVFDLRDGFPGALRVTLRVPASEGARLAANPMSHAISAIPRFGGKEIRTVTANCAAGSTTVVGPLVPGPWTLSVRSNMASWTYQTDRVEHVIAGQTADVTIEVPLYAGTLACFDAVTGAPMGNGTVMIEPLYLLERSARSEDTDEKGLVRLLLARGTYSITAVGWGDKGFDKAIGETIEWREDGPHPSSIKLLPAATTPR